MIEPATTMEPVPGTDLVDVEFTGTPEEIGMVRSMIERVGVVERIEADRARKPDKVRGSAKSHIRPVPLGTPMALSWVPEERIDPKHREFVRRNVDRAGEMLGFERGSIRIRYFDAPIGDGDFMLISSGEDTLPTGVTPDEIEPMCVGFLAGLRGGAALQTIAHEVRHVAQNVARDRLSDIYWRERDADEFAERFLVAKGVTE